jgi:zinc transporter ZupT
LILTISILILGALGGGLSVYLLGYQYKSIRLPLIFAGSYLFSITIIHILPELFSLTQKPFEVGLYLLMGFYFQSFLEYFTQGVEHGHYHAGEQKRSNLYLIIALVLHSILEGSLLTHESPFHGQNESYSLLVGIVLHKAPAAYALMAICKSNRTSDWKQGLILAVFALASPVGMLTSSMVSLSTEWFIFLYAFVSGNFLHISTTIFVETSPDHAPKFNRIAVSLLGASIAVASEFLF